MLHSPTSVAVLHVATTEAQKLRVPPHRTSKTPPLVAASSCYYFFPSLATYCCFTALQATSCYLSFLLRTLISYHFSSCLSFCCSFSPQYSFTAYHTSASHRFGEQIGHRFRSGMLFLSSSYSFFLIPLCLPHLLLFITSLLLFLLLVTGLQLVTQLLLLTLHLSSSCHSSAYHTSSCSLLFFFLRRLLIRLSSSHRFS